LCLLIFELKNRMWSEYVSWKYRMQVALSHKKEADLLNPSLNAF
jgi:hypothetical protein